jgi:hypothetical protein
MEKLLLKAKHWQIFILIFGLPFVFQMVYMIQFVSSINLMAGPDFQEMFNYMKFTMLIAAVSAIVTYSWYWSIAVGLQKMLPEGITMKVTLFKFFLFVPIVFMLFLFLGAYYFYTRQDIPSLIILVPLVPLYLFVIFCSFYCIYFIAKTIRTVELQRNVVFGDFVAEFFLIWFYFIGVWVLQPRINKMADNIQKE